MDIMPGVQENIYDDNKIRIPYKEKKHWKSSNPKGYGGWFNDRCKIQEATLLESIYAKAEPLPDQSAYEAIPPLKRAKSFYYQANYFC